MVFLCLSSYQNCCAKHSSVEDGSRSHVRELQKPTIDKYLEMNECSISRECQFDVHILTLSNVVSVREISKCSITLGCAKKL